MLKRIIYILIDFGRQMNRKNMNAYAASTAFFLFLSLIPMLILLCSIIPFTPLTEANLMLFITEITPDMADSLVVSMIADVYDKSAGIISLAAVATLWSAGKGMLALIRGLNQINEVGENRNYFALRMIACFYTFLMLLVVLLSLIVMVFGNLLVGGLIKHIPRIEGVFDFLLHFRLLFSFLIMTGGFAMIYAYIPNIKLKFSMQIPGAVFSAAIWNMFSWTFSIYVERFNDFSTYGNLSTIVIIMLWMYMCIYIIMIGAHINRYFGPAYKYFFNFGPKKEVDNASDIH